MSQLSDLFATEESKRAALGTALAARDHAAATASSTALAASDANAAWSSAKDALVAALQAPPLPDGSASTPDPVVTVTSVADAPALPAAT